MSKPPLPANEPQRLAALRRYDILDTLPEVTFDELTRLVAQWCGAPCALISFVDETREWFKSRVGIELAEVDRADAVGAHVVLGGDIFSVTDARADERFARNPLVAGATGVRFAAAAPLTTAGGIVVGTLAVFDRKPRRLADNEAESLRVCARQVMAQLELRRHLVDLARAVAEHKLTEARLSTSEAFYQTLVDTLPQYIFRKDREGRFTFANRRFCQSMGRPLGDILGRTDHDFFPPEMASKYQQDDARVLGTLEGIDTVEAHVTPGGGKLHVHVIKTPLYDALGRVVGIQGIFWDVTERKKTEEALAYERDLLRGLLSNIPDRIYFKDVQSRFLRCSRSMVRRLGLRETMEVEGKTDFDFHPLEQAREFFEDEQRIILTGTPLIAKLERQMSIDGQEIWASVTKVPLYSQSGSITGIIGISRDVTALKQAEAALAHARDVAVESVRVKSQFLANISHEIRTPMHAITGMSGLLRSTRLSPEQREYVETIQHSTTTLLGIINDILDFSKMEAGKLTLETIDFDLREAVELVVEMLAERAQARGIDLACWIEPGVPTALRGDPGRVRQVLMNLLSNAVKFTERGEVTVAVELAGDAGDAVTLRLAVQDTGIGIPPEAAPKIFEAFTQADGSTTRRFGGTGLGLTISRQLAGLMGGEIGFESVPGRGSTFWVRLPFEKQAGRGRWTADVGGSLSGELQGRRVLLVVPAPGVRAILQRQLEQWGMTVVAAAGGTGGSGLPLGDAAWRDPLWPAFDLIVLDSAMADPDALSLARQFKADAALARARIILLTTLGQRPSVAALHGAGVVACLPKPPRQARLLQCLVDVVRHQGDGPLPVLDEAENVARVLAEAARKVRILVAEDNVVNQRVALKQLKKLGYRAEAVGNGREALEVLQRERFGIVLMDCQMPELDGYEVTRRLRTAEVGQGQPPRYIVALTAHALPGDRERCLAAGMNDYLTKPLHLSDLETVLHRAVVQLQRPPPPPAAAELTLDPAVLNGLRDLREPGAADPLQELIELFLRDARPKLEKMATAAEKNDSSGLAAAAHSLKGSSSNLGARRLAALCARLEKHAKSNEWADAASLLLTVRSEFHLVETALVTEMQK